MKKLLLLLAVPFLFLVMSGCKKSFSDLTINENKPTSVPPSLLFNGIVNDIVEAPYTMKERWNQYYCCNYDYYGNNRYDFSSGDDYYSTLKNVVKMEEEAAKMGLPAGNVYSAMGKFFKAYLFSRMSLQMGDLPMSDALNGASSLKPVYDPQKNIFMKSLAWLDTANTDLSALITSGDNNLKGDIFFDNNLSKWRKVVNSLKLRLLINLSKKAGDADLNLKQQFTAVMGKSVDLLLQGRADDLAYVFIHPTNDYPMTPDNFGFDALRYNTSGTYVGLLAQLHDPRVYVTTEPAAAIVAGGASPTSFTAFVGAPPGEDQGNMYIKANSGQYSLINRYHFYQTYTGEPSIQIGYSEQCFNIAEAINRGWITSG
ncbi:MAG TPA: SusD/RagB family nutrient-binding outer membrane lipoprotein, partial [Chitinophagaceae bacterium]|nr:SusD/RagB family nutrient-binding outer membrane lipoprotein [Chitinophagaceae bacterium]